MKKNLSMPGMLNACRSNFIQQESKLPCSSPFSWSDCLTSGLAIFSLKLPSLLQFEQQKCDEVLDHNLKTLYGVQSVPSDTTLRERLDRVNPNDLHPCFSKIFSFLQRSKHLEAYQYYQGKYLISIDGTGYFSSHTVHCDSCCVKNHKDGKKTYYHQALSGALVHPMIKQVIPLPPEPILAQDGSKKNDCELNAAKRFLKRLRRDHPNLDLIVVEDAIYANGPHISLLKELSMNFILSVKPSSHKWLFEYLDACDVAEYTYVDNDNVTHCFRYCNNVPLNYANDDIRVNFLEYVETSPNGKQRKFSWATDFVLTEKNVYTIMRGGRSRWKIENETFNTLKNQGYNFEHNFGHGYQYLSTVFMNLMMLAFLIDQVQEMTCSFFSKALKSAKRRTYLWKKIDGYITHYFINSWEHLYEAIADKRKPRVVLDTC